MIIRLIKIPWRIIGERRQTTLFLQRSFRLFLLLYFLWWVKESAEFGFGIRNIVSARSIAVDLSWFNLVSASKFKAATNIEKLRLIFPRSKFSFDELIAAFPTSESPNAVSLTLGHTSCIFNLEGTWSRGFLISLVYVIIFLTKSESSIWVLTYLLEMYVLIFLFYSI